MTRMATVNGNVRDDANRGMAPFTILEVDQQGDTLTLCLRRDMADNVANLLRVASSDPDVGAIVRRLSDAAQAGTPQDMLRGLADVVQGSARATEMLGRVADAIETVKRAQAISWALSASMGRCTKFLRGDGGRDLLFHNGEAVADVLVNADGDEEELREE